MKKSRMLRISILVVYIVISLFPVIWMILTSFKARIDAISMPPKWVFKPIIENYRLILLWNPILTPWGKSMPFLRYYRNSIVITLAAIALSLIIGVPAGYYLARFRTKVASNVELWILSTRMAPPIVFLITYFKLFVKLGLFDTFRAMTLMSIALVLPLSVWMMRSFFAEVPEELEEAARVDGCSEVSAFFRITLPLVFPGLGATAILSGIFIWNDLMFGLTLTAVNAKTVPVAVLEFVHYTQIFWGQLCASGALAIFPMLVFTAIVAKFIVRGLTFGALRE